MSSHTRNEPLEDLYTRLAPVFDQVGPRPFSAFGKRLVEFADVGRGMRILDVACGRGAILRAAVDRIGPDEPIIGVDLAPGMVEACATEMHTAGHRNVDVHRMNAESLEFPDQSFDRVFCGFAISLFPDTLKALREMYRVLKPNGLVALSVLAPEQDRRWWWLAGLTRRNLQAPERFSTEQALEDEFQRAGFTQFETTRISIDMSYENEREWLDTLSSHRQGILLDTFSPQELTAFERTAARHLKLTVEADGRFHHLMTGIFIKAMKPMP